MDKNIQITKIDENTMSITQTIPEITIYNLDSLKEQLTQLQKEKEEYDISNERDVENFKRQRVEFDTIKDNEINKIQNLLNEFEKLRVEDLKSEIVLPK